MKLHVDETRHPKSASNAVGKTHRDDEQPQIFTFLSIPNDLNDCHLLEEEENEFKLLGITSIEEKITVLRKFMYLFRPLPRVEQKSMWQKNSNSYPLPPFTRMSVSSTVFKLQIKWKPIHQPLVYIHAYFHTE